MTHEKMQLAVPRFNNDVLGMQLGGTDSIPRKYQKKKHCKKISEVHQVSPLAWTNSDDRFPVLTFLTVEPNGHWRIVAVPLPYPESKPSESGSAQDSTDCLHLVPLPIDSAQPDRKSVAQETAGTTNSLPINGSATNRQNKASNRTVWKELPKNLLCKPVTAACSSASTKPTCVSKIETTAKRSHGKKNKKKPKRGKKSPDSASGTRDSDDGDQKETPKTCSSPSKDVETSRSQVSEPVLVLRPSSSHGTKPCHGPKRREKENAKAEHLSGTKGSSGCRRSPSNVVDSCSNNSPDKTSQAHHSSNGKEDHLASSNRIVQNQTASQLPKSVGNHCGQTRRESARSVWQKVHKNSASDNPGDSNRVSAPSQSNSDDLEQAKQLERSGLDSKEECSFWAESGCDRETVPPSEISCVASKAVDQNVTTRDSVSPPRERVCSKRSGSNQSLLQASSPEFIPNLFGNSVRQALERIYLADSGAQEHNFGFGAQKWMPIGLKDLGLESCAVSSSAECAVKSQTAGDIPRPRKDEIFRTLETVDEQEKGGTQNDKAWRSDEENGVSVASESALDKVAEAVNRAYELQMESEAIEKSSGRPLAEFERLLQKSSPVIHQPRIHSICNVCSRGTSLCGHERPGSPLSFIWEWYEELGVCGLEVNADDYERAERFGIDFVPFSAYFVPYLSAVQLFGKTVSSAEVDLESFRCCGSERSSASNEPELLFEYFESEPPQQRRTLYEKIQQLVDGNGPPQYQGQGDPTNLDRAKLNELHPKSWYSVAWYPIYRIPEGNFRASFLTFHSLGHLTRRSSGFDSKGAQDCIVCPAVGLQSYNAQSECWFSLRSSIEETARDINRYEILKERVRSLEETASLMARATVKKGNQTSVNRHPDFEFFCSRKRSW